MENVAATAAAAAEKHFDFGGVKGNVMKLWKPFALASLLREPVRHLCHEMQQKTHKISTEIH
jgi:hypothetical protein